MGKQGVLGSQGVQAGERRAAGGGEGKNSKLSWQKRSDVFNHFPTSTIFWPTAAPGPEAGCGQLEAARVSGLLVASVAHTWKLCAQCPTALR